MRISCIIPTYNEAARIGDVLKAVSGHPLVEECIVVDDGSKDDTEKIVARYTDVRYVKHEINRGKSVACVTRIRATTGEYLLFIDADLIGLAPEDITALITPVLSRRADVSISLRGKTPWPWRVIGLDYISGERVVPKSLVFPYLEKIERLPGFGLETFINTLIIKNSQRIKVVSWPNVESPWKYHKHGKKGLLAKLKAEAPMFRDIFRTASFPKILYMITCMLNLRVK